MTPYDQVAAVLAASTPGPWTATRSDGWGEAGWADEPDYDSLNDRVYGWWLDGPEWADESGEFRNFTPDNARFIALARNTYPELLAVARAAAEEHTSTAHRRAYGGRWGARCNVCVALSDLGAKIREVMP
jgi:hypothetical protein